jgi:hypothetical protein
MSWVQKLPHDKILRPLKRMNSGKQNVVVNPPLSVLLLPLRLLVLQFRKKMMKMQMML